jgi:hypothetical protein
MVTVYDPAQAQTLLITARQGWGLSHYEQRSSVNSGQAVREIVFRRGDEAKPNVPTHVWLPWTQLERVAGMNVDICCQETGMRLYLDCIDADGWGMRFNLGRDTYRGWHTFKYDPGDVKEAWGPCTGKKYPTEPIQPVALVIDDIDNKGSFSLGLGKITAQGEMLPVAPAAGTAACALDKNSLELNLKRGGRPLIERLRLQGLTAGGLTPEARTLKVRNTSAAAYNHYKGELAAGTVVFPLEVQLEQSSSFMWKATYRLHVPPEVKLEALDLCADMAFMNVVGLPFYAEEELLGTLDGVPGSEAVLAEPAIWEPLILGESGQGGLRIKADSPVLKTLRLLDRRVEEDLPEYGLEIVVARDEAFPTGEVKFSIVLDATP